MNSESPSLLAKIAVATFSLAVMAAVPLLTVQYAVRTHAETQTPEITANASCPRTCQSRPIACPKGTGECGATASSCGAASCVRK